jgi:hypothetical protein
MIKPIQKGSQEEYNRILDANSARSRALGQTECEAILIEYGATYEQAKNGAYVYLHHEGNIGGIRRGTREEYNRLLDDFNAPHKTPQECIRYLEHQGFRYGQSKTAVYNYRLEKGLIGKK